MTENSVAQWIDMVQRDEAILAEARVIFALMTCDEIRAKLADVHLAMSARTRKPVLALRLAMLRAHADWQARLAADSTDGDD